MQILKNVALFQINNNPVEYMLINTLFGTVEILDEEKAKIVAIWIERELGEQLPPEEVKLFEALYEHHFFVSDRDEETRLKIK